MPPFAQRRGRLLLGLVVMLVPASIALVMAYQRRWLDDDGFINLRIVQNLFNGDGPVFNLDERVEAGTSPLWLYVVALLGALGARLEDASVFAGIGLTGLAVFLAQDAAMRLHLAGGGSLRERLLHPWLPLGALSVAVLPPIWDYASGGLETGLSLAWLAAAYDALLFELTSGLRAPADPSAATEAVVVVPAPEAARPASVQRGQLGRAFLLGLGILIRPELSLYALGFFALLLISALREPDGALATRAQAARRVLSLALAFAALPLTYQLFRMGYYGTLGPNTAIAKEAFLVNWEQGRCFLRNFLTPYKLKFPLLVLALLLGWLMRELARKQADGRAGRRRLLLCAALLPTAIAALHAFYVVRMGGDYMHARMLLPAFFAALLPVAAVPALTASRVGKVLPGLCGALVLGWCVMCGTSLRVPVGNQCDIGDERGWYARMAQVRNPVRLEDYQKHMFHDWARGLVDAVKGSCPALDLTSETGHEPGCRLVHLDADQGREFYPMQLTYPLAEQIDPRLLGVVSQGAIGIAGFMLPGRVHLADIHGLADPFVARVRLAARGRPGHEKTMPAAWLLARFAKASPTEDASIAAARHALQCGELATLEQTVRGPLDGAAFFRNVLNAPALTRMRVPEDPFAAESLYCNEPPFTFFNTAGDGGDAFHWRCPKGLALSAIRGAFYAPSATLARLVGECADPRTPGSPAAASPAYGDDADTPFELRCPAGREVVGVFGTADKTVHSLGLICSDGSGTTRSHVAGLSGGDAFSFQCPPGQSARVLKGRAGSLLDALGIGCSKQESPP